MSAVLAVDGLTAGYGSVTVLRDVSVHVAAGQVVGVLGANGAGKTTLLRALSGFATVTGGDITLGGTSLRRHKPHLRARAGLMHVAEGRRLFPAMTVTENLRVAFDARIEAVGPREWQRLVDGTVYELFPRLHERREHHARSLSGGEQQMLAIGRALIQEPRVLLLDEPSTGLAPIIVDHIMDALRSLAGDGMAVVVVEQKVDVLEGLLDHAYVMRSGEIATEGDLQVLLESGALADAFFGTGVGS